MLPFEAKIGDGPKTRGKKKAEKGESRWTEKMVSKKKKKKNKEKREDREEKEEESKDEERIRIERIVNEGKGGRK